VPDVEVVDPLVVAWATGDNLPFFLAFGYDPTSLAVRHYKITEGKPVSGPRQMALGKQAAQDLGKQVGDTLRILGAPFQIVGIFETGQAMEESGGVVALSEAQDLARKPRQVNAFQLKVRRPEQVDAVLARLQTLFPDLSISGGSGNAAALEWTGLISGMAWGIAGIAIIIGGLGMMNTMVMSVFERTREVGVLRAVGWRKGRVLALILGEALLLSLLGGLVGIGLGVAMIEAASRAPSYGAMVRGGYSAGLFAQGLVTALLLGAVGGLYPAWWASRLTPIEALRYEGGGSGRSRRSHSSTGSPAAPAWRLPTFLRDLGRRRMRTALTVLGIGVGVSALVAFNGIADGMINQLNSFAGGNSLGDLTLMQGDTADMGLSVIEERVGQAIQGMPQVESISGMILGFTAQPGIPFFIVIGIEPDEPPMRHFQIVAGRAIQRPNEILLGRPAANSLKKAVGQSLELLSGSYRIVGIYQTGVAWEEWGGVLAMREAQALFNRPRQVSYYLVNVKDPADVEFVRQAIEKRFSNVSASVSSEFAQNTDDIQTMKSMTNAVVLMALIVGGIVILNTMVMTIYERTREIGTLRALGWRKRRILGMVVREAVLLSVLAGLVGILLGMGLTKLMSMAPAAGYLAAHYTPSNLAQTMIVAVLLGVLGGIYPAWRASRLSPVEALRYE
jgi:ABC-type antimicrobial peptide transport system permease subunit